MRAPTRSRALYHSLTFYLARALSSVPPPRSLTLSLARSPLLHYHVRSRSLSLARSPQEQMSIYSMQFKAAQNAFGKQRVALSGKVCNIQGYK